MIKIITTTLLITTTLAYPFEEEKKIGPPVQNPVSPEIKPVTLESDPHSEVPEEVVKENGKPEGDLKTDATFWPWPIYRSYYSYPYYSYPSYRYYSYPSYRYYSHYTHYTPRAYYHYW